tara:strand:+ start:246 stop:629 length:384 start_codon:yes stop_codon:yes gene_type:complete
MLYFKYRYKTPPKMNQTEALQTAETIFQQLGGKRKLTFMIGANNFAFGNDPAKEQVTAQFKFKTCGVCTKVNTLRVTYHRCPDVYTVEFYKVKRNGVWGLPVSTHDHIYCDQLVELFEKETGLYLHF